MTIGERIQDLRKKKYMSQEELAEEIDVSKQSVSKWELDKALPNIEKILKLCDIFEVSADYLLRGYKENVEESTDNLEEKHNNNLENQLINDKDTKSNKPLKYIIMLACSSIITIVLIIAVYYVVIFNNMGIKNSKEQTTALVTRIYSQSTKADVGYFNEDGEFITKTVYLDLRGVNEGDWIFCYPDENNTQIFRLKYKQDTCIKLIVVSIVFIIITTILTVIVIRKSGSIKNKPIKAITIVSLLAIMLSGCGDNTNTHIADTESATITEDAYTLDTTEDNYLGDDDFIKEYKDKSNFDISGCQISFFVPDGYYSAGISNDEFYCSEHFFSDDTAQSYNVLVSSITCYDEPMDYGRTIYSDAKALANENARISYPEQVIIGGNEVTYITVSYEYSGLTYNKVLGGVLLSDGRALEVKSEMIDYDGEFGLEIIRPFFEDLEINYE